MNWKNILERAAWTFVEGFLGVLVFSPELDKAAVIAAIMAGISGVKTVILEVAAKRKDELDK